MKDTESNKIQFQKRNKIIFIFLSYSCAGCLDSVNYRLECDNKIEKYFF